jgi:signal transduction histidine kinase
MIRIQVDKEKFRKLLAINTEALDFQEALFLRMLQITLLLSFIGAITNILIALPVFVSATSIAVFLTILSIYILAVHKIAVEWAKKVYVITIFLIFNVLWFYNGGIESPVLFMSVLFYTVFIFLTNGAFQKWVIYSYIINVAFLLTVQYFKGDWITGYESIQQKTIDHSVMSIIVLGTAIPLILFIQKSYITGKSKAEESERIKSSFLANMSHEIRTPMNSILGFSELLRDPDIEETDRSYFLDIIRDNGKVLLQLLNNIMVLSKLDAKLVRPQNQQIAVRRIFEQVQYSFTQDIAMKGELAFEMAIPAGRENLTIFTDELMLYQILSNLVGNAIKYTFKGHVKLGCSVDEIQNKIIFYVEDTGAGIDDNQKAIIFKRFRQGDENFTRQYSGVGLGLAICQELTELLEGKIWFESKFKEGSTFYVALPFRKNIQIANIDSIQFN